MRTNPDLPDRSPASLTPPPAGPDRRIARRAEVNGIVQGVGFRPFVFQLAGRHGVAGEVANTSSGVCIRLEGGETRVDAFLRDLTETCPPLAKITDLSVFPDAIQGRSDFAIVQSRGRAAMTTLISPDVSVCADCLREMTDPEDRRFHYPFINCTNCGPRYTIIDDTPYDRPNTSMKHFPMCDRCRAEYDDPFDRRFHAQPNACPACGPRVELLDNRRRPVPGNDPVRAAAELLRQGRILAVKGLGGFHLAADAENQEAVERLRRRKRREEKPLALMAPDLETIRRFADVTPEEEALLTSHRRPIVLLRKKTPNAIAGAVSPNNRYFGVMLPYTPLHHLLLMQGFPALVMTSGNLSEAPIAIDNADAFDRLAEIADFFLVHNRDIYIRCDDAIVTRAAGAARFIRRSRGYVPEPVFLAKRLPNILACGAELKNTVCLVREDRAFLSQHIGDIENRLSAEFFESTIDHMKRILDIAPAVIAHDMHPDYFSARYALEQRGVRKIAVQHHHAHIASCMAENRIEGPVIGLALDGTGYGTDGAVWGGEVLLVDRGGFERKAHIAYLPMPGGAAAIKEPWRMAVSYLHQTFGEEMQALDLPVLKRIDPKKVDFMVQMIRKRVNAPDTSSLGRLFDGVAALLGLRTHVHYEGQAAVELEMTAADAEAPPYAVEWTTSGDVLEIPFQPVIRGVVRDIQKGVKPEIISRRFHETVIRVFADVCRRIGDQTGVREAALSGGAFQNALLLTGMIKALEKENFTAYAHTQVPANDGGVSLGQAWVAGNAVNRD